MEMRYIILKMELISTFFLFILNVLLLYLSEQYYILLLCIKIGAATLWRTAKTLVSRLGRKGCSLFSYNVVQYHKEGAGQLMGVLWEVGKA